MPFLYKASSLNRGRPATVHEDASAEFLLDYVGNYFKQFGANPVIVIVLRENFKKPKVGAQ